MFSHIKGGTQAKVTWKQDPEANIRAQEVENGEWRKVHNEELHSLHRLPNIVRVIKSRRLKWADHVARMEEGRCAFKIFRGTPAEKIFWKDDIRMYLKEIDINTNNWVDSAQDTDYWRVLVNAVLNHWVP